MELLLTICFGASIGLTASFLVKSGRGVLWDVLMGIAGAFFSVFTVTFLEGNEKTAYTTFGGALPFLGACIVICCGRIVEELEKKQEKSKNTSIKKYRMAVR